MFLGEEVVGDVISSCQISANLLALWRHDFPTLFSFYFLRSEPQITSVCARNAFDRPVYVLHSLVQEGLEGSQLNPFKIEVKGQGHSGVVVIGLPLLAIEFHESQSIELNVNG